MDAGLSALRGDSPRITAIRGQVAQLIARRAGSGRLPPVLLLGETGTGKGLLARSIHEASPRSAGPFVDVNCAAIPESLLEAELFGYERGAFTDARQAKAGLFQTAHGGTLFLDEIGLLPASLQGKLLTVLEDRAIRRLGGTRVERVDVVLVAATSVDLKRAVGEHRFREDLYHRLAVITLELPPLRARGGDILALAEHFLARACADYGQTPRTLTPDARQLLATYRWPGNVRELANAMERVVLLSDPDAVTASMLGFLAGDAHPDAAGADPRAEPSAGSSLDDALRARIEAALRETDGNIRRTATALGISRNTLRARMDKYGLRDPGASAAPVRRSGPAPLHWERRHLAFLRARLLSASTTDNARALDVVAEKVTAFGGRIEESGPSGVIALFGLEPVDNAPSHAAHAALAIQRAAGDGRVAVPPPPVVIAIHCAELLVARVGSTVHIDVDSKGAGWATLEALVTSTSPGTIAVSDAAAPFLARRFVLEGLPDGHPTWTVRGRRQAEAGWGSVNFVGRSGELEILRQAAARAERGQGQVVGVVGEAGVGKSRLFLEAVRQLHGWHVLASGGAPYATHTSYFPVVELLKRHCHVEDTDTVLEMRDKIIRRLPAEAGDPAPMLSPILDLCGLLPGDDPFRGIDPAQRRRRTHEAIKQVLLAASDAQPLCLIVEDLHWVDAETLAVLDLLAESITASPVLVLVNYRPELPGGWGSRAAYTQIRLDLLPAKSAEELLVALLGADPSLAGLKRTLIDRTEGNPFFIEECVRTLAETGVVVGAAPGYRLAGPPGDLALPSTIQAVIAARIDRLSRDDRVVLQAAAAIGEDVPVAILRSITEVTGAAFDDALVSLRRAELLHETRAYPEAEYRFKHALTHDVAYDGLPPDERRALHARVVEAIEQLHGDRLTEHVERLVYHATRGALWEKAAGYAHEAGLKAFARSAHAVAIGHVETGRAALRALPDTAQRRRRELGLLITLGEALVAIKGLAAPEVEELYTRARALCEEVGEPAQLFLVLRGLGVFYMNRGQLAGSLALAYERLELAQRLADPMLVTIGHAGVVSVLYHMGDFHGALAHVERARASAERDTAHDAAVRRASPTRSGTVTFLSHAAWSLWFVGAIDQSRTRSQEALALAREQGHSYALTNACYWAAQLAQYHRDRARTRELADAVIALAGEEGFAQQQGQGLFLRGWALAEPGREAAGLALMRDGFAAWEATGAGVLRPYYLALLAEVAAQAGDVQEGLRLLAEALVVVDKSGERSWQAEVHRLHGELLLRQAGGDAVTSAAAETSEACYRRALAVARDQHARSLELRAAMSLGRLWQRAGERARARELLAPIYRSFDGGLDTVDLRDALALLETLS